MSCLENVKELRNMLWNARDDLIHIECTFESISEILDEVIEYAENELSNDYAKLYKRDCIIRNLRKALKLCKEQEGEKQ